MLWWRAQGGRRRTAFGRGPRYAAVRRRTRDQRDPLSRRRDPQVPRRPLWGVGRAGGVDLLWREWREVQDDGTIIMKARGYDQFGAHWTGWVEIAPDGPDFGLWTWILSQEDRFPEIISGEAL